jgi:shikimate dehydrogenase
MFFALLHEEGFVGIVDECPALPYEAMDSHTLLYDLIYNPDETLFMKKGKEHGATVKNGLEMLLLQAFASWDFWHQEKSEARGFY